MKGRAPWAAFTSKKGEVALNKKKAKATTISKAGDVLEKKTVTDSISASAKLKAAGSTKSNAKNIDKAKIGK